MTPSGRALVVDMNQLTKKVVENRKVAQQLREEANHLTNLINNDDGGELDWFRSNRAEQLYNRAEALEE